MTRVVIQISHEVDQRVDLVKTIDFSSPSEKALNGKSALNILRKAVPDLSEIAQLTKYKEGWLYSRSLQAKPHCAFQYKWERFYVFERCAPVSSK